MSRPAYTLDNHQTHPITSIGRALDRESEDWADFFESAAVPLQVLSPEGTIVAANRAALELLGHARASYIGRSAADFHADDRSATSRNPVIKDILASLAHGEAVHRSPARLRHRDGSIREVLISASPVMKQGRLIRSRCVILDVTERRQQEEYFRSLADELQRTVDQLSPLLRALPQVGILVSQDGADVRLNGNLAALLSSAGCGTRDDGAADPGPIQNGAQARSELSCAHATADGIDPMEVLQGNGAARPFTVDAVPLFDAAGKPRGSLSFVMDPVEQRRFEREVMKAERKREEHFTGLVMELRNALGAIRDANELIKARMSEDSVVRQSRKMIDRQVRQATRLLDRELPLVPTDRAARTA